MSITRKSDITGTEIPDEEVFEVVVEVIIQFGDRSKHMTKQWHFSESEKSLIRGRVQNAITVIQAEVSKILTG